MTEAISDLAIKLMRQHRYKDALPLLHQAIAHDPLQWTLWYQAGQCYRFNNDIDRAVKHLYRASELKNDSPELFLALGIALQLNTKLNDAINAFQKAIRLDPDYSLAYNSLALTQKLSGDLDSALVSYESGAEAHARKIIKAMQNHRENKIYKHRDTEGSYWIGYAIYGAAILSIGKTGVDKIATPTGLQALEEEQTERHAGLYWVDIRNSESEVVRFLLPNFFNTFREQLKRDSIYSNLIGNRGTVLKLLENSEEADKHFDEATEFKP